jgi:hypothetical protein
MKESKTNLFVVISKFRDNYMYLPEIYLLEDSKFPPKTIHAFLGGLVLDCTIFQRIENHSIKAMKGESKIDTFLQHMHPPNIPASVRYHPKWLAFMHPSFSQTKVMKLFHSPDEQKHEHRERERERERERVS